MGRIKIITRRGGGLPEREFAGFGEAAEWIIGTGRSSNPDIKVVAQVILAGCRNSQSKSPARRGAYGFGWESRERRVTRSGGGLPEREFDSLASAARWCREAGLTKAKRDDNVTTRLSGRRFGFDWKLERPSSERPSSDETETDGQALNLGSKWESKWKRTGRRRQPVRRRRIDGSTPLGEVIARLGAEIEDDRRILEEKRRLLDERRRILVRLEKMEKTRREGAGEPGEPGTATARQEAS